MTGKKPSLKPGEWRWIDKGIFVRGSKHGDRYGVSYTDPDTRKRVRKLVGDRVTRARHELEVIRGRIREGTLPKKLKNPRFTDFAEEYLSHVEHTKRSWLRDEVCVRRFVALFGAQPLDSITTHEVELYKIHRSRECVPRTDRQIMPRTVNLELNVLKRMFNLAIRWDYVDSNPVRGVEPLKERQRPMRVLTPEEEQRLLEAASVHLRRIIGFALNTGCRRSEILNLRWTDVDLKAGAITLSQTKTDRVRTVYINPEVRAILRNCGLNQGGYVFGYRGKGVQRLATAWRNAVKKSEIAPIRFHDLRHCAATRMLRAGADIVTVQKVLGHSRLETTTRYLHSDEAAQRAAMNALSSVQVAPK